LAHAVYVDAFVPSDGQSLFDILPRERREQHYLRQARASGAGWLVPAPPAIALGISDPARASWLEARLTPQPLRTFEQPLRIGAAVLPRTYIHWTAGPVASSFAPFAGQAEHDPAWRYHELATGHDAMLTVPDQLAGLLLTAAG
jgi:hypothetical protein